MTHTYRPLLTVFALVWAVSSVYAQSLTPPMGSTRLAYTDSSAIYLHDMTTHITRTIPVGHGTPHVWDFSPDGCRLLFTLTDQDRPSQVFSIKLDASDPRSLVDLADLPDGAWDMWEPDWSPTGDRIAFTLSRPVEAGIESRIAWVPAAGGTPTFYSVAGAEHQPRWSPDGVWLAYISYEQRPAGASLLATAEPETAATAPTLREADIWIVSANGLTKERITRFDVGSATQPRWSPDSTLLSFRYAPTPGEHQFWMIAAVPDAIPTQLNYVWVDILDSVWQPDGLALVAAVRDLQQQPDNRLWQVPLTGSADDASVPYLPTADPPPADFPRFSADGRYLAYRSGYRLHIYDHDTDSTHVIVTTGNTPPVWSPADIQGETACDT